MPPLPASLATLLAIYSAERVEAGEAGALVLRLTGRGETLYLKQGEGRVAAAIVDEFARLAWLRDRLPCAPIRQFVHDGAQAWLLTEAVAGRTGDDWIEDDAAHLPMVIDAFAGFLRRLHALPVDECPFDAGAAVRVAAARANVRAGLVDTDDFDDDHLGMSAEEMLAEVERLRPPRLERVVTHGDFSLGNLLIDDAGRVTGCIDVGRVGVADRYQDIAILWQNLRDFSEEAAERFLAVYDVAEVDRARLDFHRALDEMF